MKLSLGIVGLPNVGKSTLFNALTNKGVLIANYPFATIDPSVGVVAVPDERLYKLAEFSKTQKTIPAAIEFVDIAGLVKGASAGEGLGNAFLSNIRETDAICEVVRIFEDGNILHVNNKIDPLSDIEVINLELILADQETVKRRIGNLGKDVKAGKKDAIAELAVCEKLAVVLETGLLANQCKLTKEEKVIAKHLHLLTMKPFMYVLNKKAGATNLDETNDERFQKLVEFLNKNSFTYVIVDAGVEHELKDFQGEEKEMFRKELGASSDGVDDLIKTGYKLLNLATYFTTGEKETRAWTILDGSTAPQAGAAIHGDFEEKFIKADVISWEELLKKGNWRTEGKEYIVKDGDVMEFKV